MKYKIYFQISPTQPYPFHNSYIKYVEELVEPFLQKELKKHKYPFGEYVANVMFNFKIINNADTALLFITSRKLNVWINCAEPNFHIGSIELDFDSDNIICKKETNDKYVNPLEDISKFNPKFKITNSHFLPSQSGFDTQIPCLLRCKTHFICIGIFSIFLINL